MKIDKSHRLKYNEVVVTRFDLAIRGGIHISWGFLFGMMVMWLITHSN